MKFYRYDVWQNTSATLPGIYLADLHLSTYYLVKETKCGYWIDGYEINPLIKDCRIKNPKKYHCKWISKDGKRRFAYPTKKEALYSCIKRTEKRLAYAKMNYEIAEHGLKLLKENYDKEI